MCPRKPIGYEIKSLSNLLKRRIQKESSDSGLKGVTGMQGWIIGYLYHNENAHDIFQRDLEKEFDIRRSTATGILQLMEKNGLITRETVKYDARLKKIKLTPLAISIHRQFTDILKDVENNIRSGLTKEEIDAFFATIEKIKHNLI